MLLRFFLVLSILQICHSCIPTQQIGSEKVTTTTTTTSTTTTAPVLSCLSGWQIFERDSYSWCMKIAYVSGNGGQRDGICTSLNAQSIPTGFENPAEISKMIGVSQSEQPGTLYLFLGAQKLTSCQLVAVTASCTQTNSFYWTDGYTGGSLGFNWASGEPTNSNVLYGGLLYYKILMMINSQDGLMYAVNKLDVHDGVVCGMKAQYY